MISTSKESIPNDDVSGTADPDESAADNAFYAGPGDAVLLSNRIYDAFDFSGALEEDLERSSLALIGILHREPSLGDC